MNDPHEELYELESAIHHLKEAQQLHNEEEYDFTRQEAAVGKVVDALNEIDRYLEAETERLNDISPDEVSP